MKEILSMCPACGKLIGRVDMMLAEPIPGLIPRHDSAGAECAGTGQSPRNPESDRRPLWNGEANPHIV